MMLTDELGDKKTSCVSGTWRRSLLWSQRGAYTEQRTYEASMRCVGSVAVMVPPKSSLVADMAR